MGVKERVSRLARSRADSGDGGDSRPPSAALRTLAVELVQLGREMVAIPLRLWLRLAELAGAAVLWAWLRAARPLLAVVLTAISVAYGLALRHVTPARGVAVVAIASVVVLAASQWVDYRAVSIGNDDYAGSVGLVAPAPEIATDDAGEAHSWVMVPIALAGLVVIGFALAGRRKLARLLIPLGLAVIAIALLVDVSKGLDEGGASIAYDGAVARLREGFWLQLAAAVGMIACGLMLPPYLRRDRAASPTRRQREPSRRSRERSRMPIGEART